MSEAKWIRFAVQQCGTAKKRAGRPGLRRTTSSNVTAEAAESLGGVGPKGWLVFHGQDGLA